MAPEISVRVNGVDYRRAAEPRRSLADFLREDLGLTGTHVGCEHGACGSCTVLLDGETVRSCLLFAVQADGSEITTVEGLAEGGELSVLQQSFWDHHGLQCGFCTPGMLVTATELLREIEEPSEGEIREAISGVLCRCTGYQHVIESIQAAVRSGRAGGGGPSGESAAGKAE